MKYTQSHPQEEGGKDPQKKTPEYTPNPEYDFFRANSATDCTGSVPRPPETDDELDSYLNVYNFLPQCAIARGKETDSQI